MITVILAGKWLELTGGTYPHRVTIMQLAGYPDVQWDADRRRWLVDARLWPKLWHELGEYIAPVSADVLMALPIDAPGAGSARRTRRAAVERAKVRKQAAAAAVRMGKEMGGR